jgi:hypothetical protein
MSEVKFSYYQFQKKLGYQVYLRFEDFEFENLFTDFLQTMGFDKVERNKVKEIPFDKKNTRVLKIVKASPRVARQIDTSNFGSDHFGAESLSPMGSYNVYKYRNVGMMIFGEGNLLWELGIKSTHDHMALRAIFTRFLSFALVHTGVVGFWGVPVDEGFVVMTPNKSQYESVFVDLNQNALITQDGIKNIDCELQILRLDSTIRDKVIGMKKEALLSFLSTNTCYFSYSGFERELKNTIFELAQVAQGFIYPEENYKPRISESQAI